MGFIHYGQQFDVLPRVPAWKASAAVPSFFDLPRRQILPDEPGQLRSAQACCLSDIATQQSFPRFA